MFPNINLFLSSELSFLSFSQSSQPHPLLPSTNKKTHLLLGWIKKIWRQMCKCGCTTTFKKCYVNVGAQPLSIKATKFPKWMWVYNNFKKLQNCKINVGVQDKAIHWLWEVLIFFPFRFSSFNLIQYPNDVEEFKWNFMFTRYILFTIYRNVIVKLSFSLLSISFYDTIL